jgi:hypothetical protein
MYPSTARSILEMGVTSVQRGYIGIVRRRWSAACAVLLAVEIAGCAGPARTATDYRLKARNSAKAALSAVETSTLAARLVREGRTFSPYVSVVLDSAERDVTAVESTFASIQPPGPSSDQLREQLDTVLNDAADTISSMRIASRRDERRNLLAAAERLPKLSSDLQGYSELPA